MKITINDDRFAQAFRDAGRGDNFSYAGLQALFEYLQAYEDDGGEEIKLDVIAICCEFTEYEDLEEFQDAYGAEYEDIDDIAYHTLVIPIAGTDGFIIQDF